MNYRQVSVSICFLKQGLRIVKEYAFPGCLTQNISGNDFPAFVAIFTGLIFRHSFREREQENRLLFCG